MRVESVLVPGHAGLRLRPCGVLPASCRTRQSWIWRRCSCRRVAGFQMEGEQRGKVEVVAGLLRVGVSWDVIVAATGLTDAGFQKLKVHLSQAGS